MTKATSDHGKKHDGDRRETVSVRRPLGQHVGALGSLGWSPFLLAATILDQEPRRFQARRSLFSGCHAISAQVSTDS